MEWRWMVVMARRRNDVRLNCIIFEWRTIGSFSSSWHLRRHSSVKIYPKFLSIESLSVNHFWKNSKVLRIAFFCFSHENVCESFHTMWRCVSRTCLHCGQEEWDLMDAYGIWPYHPTNRQNKYVSSQTRRGEFGNRIECVWVCGTRRFFLVVPKIGGRDSAPVPNFICLIFLNGHRPIHRVLIQKGFGKSNSSIGERSELMQCQNVFHGSHEIFYRSGANNKQIA